MGDKRFDFIPVHFSYVMLFFYHTLRHLLSPVNACECDTNKVCIPEGDIQDKTQNSAINICISTDASEVDIANIKELKIEDESSSSGISYLAVDEYAPNALTEVIDPGSKNVMVSTRLVSAFFSELNGGTAELKVTGTALMEFASGSRRLISFRGSKDKSNKDVTAVRGLEEDDVAGLGEYEMVIGISGLSPNSGFSMMKGVAQALIVGLTAVVLV